MKSRGIYLLANDVVYDQLVALLNSIEVNVGNEIPVCVIPYNERLDKVLPEIEARDNVTLYDNPESIQRWKQFTQEVWAAHPRAKKMADHRNFWLYQGNTYRKFVSFDGPFENFVFYDTDSLAMKPLDNVFEKLEHYTFVFDDWEHIKPKPIAALDIPLIESTGAYQEKDVRPKLHCSSFFGSKSGRFNSSELLELKKCLIDDEEVKWINPKAWWDEAALFTYMTLRDEGSLFNYTWSSDGNDRTGNCANVDPFVNLDNVLYNKDGLKPIHRIHYMCYSSKDFTRLSQGEKTDIPYEDVFLHYRFLKNPDQKPTQLKPPSLLKKTDRLFQRSIKKFKSTIALS